MSWLEPNDDMAEGYYWCECLEPDAPPQLLRSYQQMVWDSSVGGFVVATDKPRVWDRWTTAGWVPLVGRVCPISPRPTS